MSSKTKITSAEKVGGCGYVFVTVNVRECD